MDMQDKDLDKLFQSALENYTVDPSATVWAGIENRLNTGKPKRSLIALLGIAAGLILFISAGILFIPKEFRTTRLQGSALLRIKPKVNTNLVVAHTKPAVKQNNGAGYAIKTPVNTFVAINKIKIKKQIAGHNLAAVTQDMNVINPVVPDTATRILIEPVTDPAPVFAAVSPIMPIQIATENIKVITLVKKHKIRSLGDVFNAMIGAVDKREDKILEFSNNDEDDATITGVNLGIIKLKKGK